MAHLLTTKKVECMEEKKEKKTPSIVKRVLIGLGLILLVGIGAFWGVFHNEIKTLASMEILKPRNDEHQDGAVYTMHVSGDYYFDEFLEQGGVTDDAELVSFVTSHITHGLVEMKVDSPNIGCSSFTAQTQEGDKVFGRNYDFSKTNTCLVFTDATEDRHATISTIDFQFFDIDVNKDLSTVMDYACALAAPYAPIDGINDAGVACGVYMTYQGEETVATDQNTSKPDLTSTTMLRAILDYADNVDEAVEIAQSFDMHDSANTSFHYMVADASGRSVILEWVGSEDGTDNDGGARELRVTYNDDDAHIGQHEGETSYQVVTNFIIQPGYYDNAPVEEMKGLDRYEEIYARLDAVDGILPSEKDGVDILQAVGRRTWKNDDANHTTVHSALYNMTDKTVTWVPNEHFDDPDSVYVFGFDD